VNLRVRKRVVRRESAKPSRRTAEYDSYSLCAGINVWAPGQHPSRGEERIAVERRRIVVAPIHPHRLRGIGNVEDDDAFITIGDIEPIAILLNLMAGNHLIAAVRILSVAFRKRLADVLADDMEARDDLRSCRRVVAENV
jgi:hypothetical protein